jgi:hypothetical protein
MGFFDFVKDFFNSSNEPRLVKKAKSLNSNELRKLLLKELKPSSIYIKIGDKDYNPVEEQWLLYPFYNYFEKVMDGLKIPGWRKKFDCDNFSSGYRFIAQALHLQGKTSEQSIAVGEMSYRRDKGGLHAINIAVVEFNNIIFIEPQTGVEKCLSTAEKRSCYFVQF